MAIQDPNYMKWLCAHEKDEFAAYCKVCMKTIELYNMGKKSN